MSKVFDSSADAAASAPLESSGWIVAALAFAQLISWGSVYYSFSLFIVPMEREFGWDRAAMNGALSLGLLISGLCAYPVGHWIDRHGGRKLMTLGSAFASLLFVLWAYADTLTTLYVVWIGLGAVMAATLYDPVFAVITRSYPLSFRTKIIALTLVGGFASTVFIPLTQFLVESLGWRHALLVLALINLVVCVPIHGSMLRDSRVAKPQDHKLRVEADNKAAVARALRHPAFWALMVCFTTYYANFAAITFHLIPLLMERGVKTGIIMTSMALIGPAQVAARVILLAVGKRLDTAVTGRIVMTIFPIPFLLLILLPASTATLICAVLLYGGMNGMITIIRGTAVPDLLWKEGYGAINGLLSLPSNIAKAVGPIGAALIWSWHGNYFAVLWTVFAMALLSALSFWIASFHRQQ